MKTVVILGAGNVAFHLTRAMVQNTIQVRQIFNRTLHKAQEIGEANKIRYTDKISEIEKADVYIIASADSAIKELSHHVPFDDALVVHTSGSMPMDTLQGNYRKGVFYPLQTFSKKRRMRYSDLPFFIEAENPTDSDGLVQLAKKISDEVHIINSAQRAQLHLSAVWVCNFVNQMYQIGFDICRENNLDFDVLRPLIAETANKIQDLTPAEAQTGPAKRNDQAVIDKHLSLLKDSNLYQIYQEITEEIQKSDGKKL